MKGWEVKALGEVCDILDNRRKPITKRDRIPGPYPYYGATGVLDHVASFIFDETLVLVGEDGAKWGAGEKSAFSAHGKYWVNNHAHVIKPKRNILLDQWLIYHLNANDLSAFITGLTVPKLNQGRLREIPIPLPPLDEQRRIVAILDEAFAGLAVMRQHAEANLKNARALFDGHLNAIFSQRGDGWVETTLDQLASEITDGDHMPPPKAAEGVPFITISNIEKSRRRIDFSDTFLVPRTYFDGLKPSKKPMVGDVLYTVTGSFGIPVRVDEQKEFCFQRHIGLVRPKAGIDSKWLNYALLSGYAFKQAEEGATGTAQKTVSLKVLRGIRLPIMALHEQMRVASSMDELETETTRLEALYRQKLVAIDELKQSILHRAFSGQLTREAIAA
jgi:type I restriction enzyme S subunit